MATSSSSPEIAARNAFVDYLDASLRAIPGLENSSCVDAWPEPTDDLRLGDDRIVVAVSLSEAETTYHQPSWVSGNASEKRQRYCMGVVFARASLGVWAASKGLRDDVDWRITQLMNQPFWTTIQPIVNTMIALPIAKPGDFWVMPASMNDVEPGMFLRISDTENVRVSHTKHDRFRAVFKQAHSANASCVEQKARRNHIEHTLHLRCAQHFNAIARYVFDSAQNTDAPGQIQRQEWRSVRNGVIQMPLIHDVAGASQTSLSVNKTWTLGD